MYSWKKFKFGKSKDEKEVKKDKLFHFHHKHTGSDSSVGMDGFGKEKSVDSYPSSAEITPYPSEIPSRNSSNNLSGTTRNDTMVKSNSSNHISLHSGNKKPGSSSSTVKDMPLQGMNTELGDQEKLVSEQQAPKKANSSSSGIMTIKVYNGDGFHLPFPITSNKKILGRLLESGIPSDNRDVNADVDMILQQISRLELANGNNKDNLLPGDIATKSIPSTIKLPNSTPLNPLLYFTIEFDNTVATIEPESGTMAQPIFNKISTFDVTRKLPQLNIDVFVRIPSILLPPKTWQQEMGAQDEKLQSILDKINSNQDVHLDSFQLPINLFIDSAASIRLYNHHWVELRNGLGKINISVDYKPSRNKPLSIDDFDLLKVIGKGSFGKVMQVRKKDTKKVYALKAIRKSYIVSKSEVTHTLAERTVLARIDCPFIVPLKFSFQSPEKLYLVLACINGGELFYHLQREGRFDLSRSRFYAAELLCALETLHKMDVIYRDLKPENILLDYQGHIALCDFGLCKLNMKDDDKTDTFCGTPEYLAPELLMGQGYTKVVDWWTLGVLLYEMLTGLPPYYDENVPKMYKKILQDPLVFPDGFDRDAKDLLIVLLSRDPQRRLGFNGAEEIKSHPFFAQLSWKRLLMKGYIPPYKPPVTSATDTSNFDQEFTREKPIDSVVDEYLSESVQKQFGGWTYVGSEQLGSSLAQGGSIR
ncbi:Serine/threonine-protein kinase YPK2/YKR2 [Nakaseomyces bracarensis]|uniref:Serine/threonine-protein kinase YPK2/YKR2 n=1 Tax=Nakaseomyces bracarensis TaxID=273131 RepID=A0ABR4NMY8_9SACH